MLGEKTLRTPECPLIPVPPLLSQISDFHLSLVIPLFTYWTLGLIFHFCDTAGYFPRYRIHLTTELATRNRVSRLECLRGVLVNQLLQTILGLAAGWGAEPDVFGDEEYQCAAWAGRVRCARHLLPRILAILGVNAGGLDLVPAMRTPVAVGSCIDGELVDEFAAWELNIGRFLFYAVTPILQFTFAVLIADSWQYFGHRWMHNNKFMYKHVHSRHHTLTVPYAYGSLYTHPLEGLLQDTLGVALAFYLTGMSTRQGMVFYFGSTVKDVYDHCGYNLPWIPVRSAASFHDLHHQGWGMNWNFSVYTSFWDRVFGTLWTDDKAARENYERGIRFATALDMRRRSKGAEEADRAEKNKGLKVRKEA